MEKKIGIYQIRNIINGKSYIGKSINIKVRKWEHKNSLLKNKHPNGHLQASFNKYGEEAFRFRILKTFEKITPQELTEWEDKLIIEYKTLDPEFGFNLIISTTTKYTKIKKEERAKYHAKLAFKSYRTNSFFKTENSNKEKIFKILDEYNLKGFKIKLVKRKSSMTIIVLNKESEVERLHIEKDTLEITSVAEIKNAFAILEIETGTSNIIGRWGSPNEVVKQYDLKYASLSTVLHANRDKQTAFYSLKDKFFIREQDYNPDYIYETQWQINAKAPKEVKGSKVHRAIEELDSNGTVIKTFARRSDVVNEYSLRGKSLDRVLSGERSKIASRYFRYV